MDSKQRRIALIGAVIPAVAALPIALYSWRGSGTDPARAGATPVLAVVMTRAQLSTLPLRIPASGNIAPWQEASVGTEADGLQLTEVKVNVGDRVRRGQVLAVFRPEMVVADLAEAQASVAQARARRIEAEANAERARRLDGTGAMSDASGGQEMSLQYSYPFEVGNGRLSPSVGAKWLSKDSANYFYGTLDEEVARGVVDYRPGSVVIPGVGVSYFRPLGEKWTLLGFAKYDLLPDDITDSPFIERDTDSTFTVFLGFSRGF